MKTNQFTSALFTTMLLFSLTVAQFACDSKSGEVGPAGADGAVGATGPAGPQGPVGAVGAANVTQISFGAKTHTGASLPYVLPGITADMINKSSFFVYVQNGAGSWYPLPGIVGGTFTTNEYRTYMLPTATNSTMTMWVTRVGSSTTTDTFAATRVLIIPAATLINGRKAAPDVNYADYEAVKRHYNLAD